MGASEGKRNLSIGRGGLKRKHVGNRPVSGGKSEMRIFFSWFKSGGEGGKVGQAQAAFDRPAKRKKNKET